MATLGTAWIDELVTLLVREGIIKQPSTLDERIRASLKELVAGHNRAEGKVPPP